MKTLKLALWLSIIISVAKPDEVDTNIRPKGKCSLPDTWRGSWSRGDMDDHALPITIGHYGIRIDDFEYRCIESIQDVFIFQEIMVDERHSDKEVLYRCFFFMEKHRNVLLYKKSESNDMLTMDLCFQMTSDLHFLYRMQATGEPCPLPKVLLDFGYSRKGCLPFCESGSRIYTCSDSSLLQFNYEACVDDTKTEKFIENVKCIGSWQSQEGMYFIGLINSDLSRHNVFRCFHIAAANENLGLISYRMSRSGDYGSCSHALTPQDGAWIYNVTYGSIAPPQAFPTWFESGIWVSLNLTLEFHVNSESGRIQITAAQQSSTSPPIEHFTSHQLIGDVNELETASYASYEATQLFGCRRLAICIDLYKRDMNVIQIELYKNDDGICQNQGKTNPYLTYTLVKQFPQSVTCPFQGYHLAVAGSFQSFNKNPCTSVTGSDNLKLISDYVQIGCNKSPESNAKIEFYSKCSSMEERTLNLELECISTWEEGKSTYVITNNSELGVPGYRCLELHSNIGTHRISMLLNDCKSPNANDDYLPMWSFDSTQWYNCSNFAQVQNYYDLIYKPNGGLTKDVSDRTSIGLRSEAIVNTMFFLFAIISLLSW